MHAAAHDYAGEHDYARMRALLQQAYGVCGPAIGMTVGDLDYWRFQDPDPTEVMRSCRLWTDPGGAALGFAWPGVAEDDEGVIDVFAHPDHPQLLEPMLDWAEAWHARGRPGRSVTLQCRGDDTVRAATLTGRGYERTATFSHWYRVRDMAAALPEAGCPGGYRVRSADPCGDAAGITRTNNASGAGPVLTEAACRALMSSPTYASELHLVATPRDSGDVVAFCIVWFDVVNRVGLFEPVACAPGHQRRGLARAVMAKGLRRLAGLEATHALVATGGGNVAANRLYESLGFAEHGLSRRWRKTLRAPG